MSGAWKEPSPNWGYKKKLYAQPHPQPEPPQTVEVCSGKSKVNSFTYTPGGNELAVRSLLQQKVVGGFMGIWLLVPELLSLKAWDLLKLWTDRQDYDLEPRLALQVLNEAALCVTRMRRKQSLSQSPFELANGLPWLATDTQIHHLLSQRTCRQAKQLQLELARVRLQNGHFPGKTIAIDPHRLISTSKRAIPKRKFSSNSKPRKLLQTFFAQDTQSAQPLFVLMNCPAQTATKAAIELMEMTESVIKTPKLVLADKEHCNEQLFSYYSQHPTLDLLTPCPMNQKIKKRLPELHYHRQWAGYAIAETAYQFKDSCQEYRLIGQRFNETEQEFKYNGFLTTANHNARNMLCEEYPTRWHLEEFFRFEQEIGWKKVHTWNQNQRFGKMSIALIAQAACFQFKQKLPPNCQRKTAVRISEKYFRNLMGDIRVKDEKIIITFYNCPEEIALNPFYRNIQQNLKRQGVDPRIPWLYNFVPEFRFK